MGKLQEAAASIEVGPEAVSESKDLVDVVDSELVLVKIQKELAAAAEYIVDALVADLFALCDVGSQKLQEPEHAPADVVGLEVAKASNLVAAHFELWHEDAKKKVAEAAGSAFEPNVVLEAHCEVAFAQDTEWLQAELAAEAETVAVDKIDGPSLIEQMDTAQEAGD